jgi:hypothetical protein
MTAAVTLFSIAAIVANIALPFVFVRDVRARFPALWTALGSPAPTTDSMAVTVSKTLKRLRAVSADAAFPPEQRTYARRWWQYFVAAYVCGFGGFLLIVIAR